MGELADLKSGSAGDPAVSVVIPTRNRWDLLPRRGLRAALNQTGVSLEILVVDDGSEKRAPALESLALANVSVIEANRHVGLAAARNIGIDLARGEWIAFLDDDDLWAPRKLRFLIEALQSSGADFAYSSGVLLDAELKAIHFTPAVPPDQLLEAMLKRCAIEASGSNVVVSAALLQRLGGFDEAFSTAADWEMLLRLAKFGRGVAVQKPLVAYCPSSWLLEEEQHFREECERLAQVHPEVSVDWAGWDRWAAESFHLAGRYAAAAARYLSAGLRHATPRTLGLAGRASLRMPVRRHLRTAPVDEMEQWLMPYRA
jgi:glycosyltransferase involved in cell wall biosynthesis